MTATGRHSPSSNEIAIVAPPRIPAPQFLGFTSKPIVTITSVTRPLISRVTRDFFSPSFSLPPPQHSESTLRQGSDFPAGAGIHGCHVNAGPGRALGGKPRAHRRRRARATAFPRMVLFIMLYFFLGARLVVFLYPEPRDSECSLFWVLVRSNCGSPLVFIESD